MIAQGMKLWVLSDIHLALSEARSFRRTLHVPAADICIVAGDVTDDLVAGLEWLGEVVRPHMPVVTVLGNHEFYGHDIPAGRRAASSISADLGLTLLDDTMSLIDGTRFVGGTLWSDFRLFEGLDQPHLFTQRECMTTAKRQFADFDEIWATEASERQMARLISPRDMCVLHEATAGFIDTATSGDFEGKTVVVTHHAPSPLSIAPRFRNEATSAAFASDLVPLIERRQPTLWVHGHVHESLDYKIGATQVVCNPKGYDRFPNATFQPDLVIEI